MKHRRDRVDGSFLFRVRPDPIPTRTCEPILAKAADTALRAEGLAERRRHPLRDRLRARSCSDWEKPPRFSPRPALRRTQAPHQGPGQGPAGRPSL
jgi:hypothetical protein